MAPMCTRGPRYSRRGCCTTPPADAGTQPSCAAAYPASDPLHQAPSILHALRLRHAVRTNLASGNIQQHELQLPAGLANVDRHQHAAVTQTSSGLTLRVRDLLSQTIVHTWRLPHRFNLGELHMWRWRGAALALPYCEHGTSGSRDTQVPGALLVHADTGSCASVDLLFWNPYPQLDVGAILGRGAAKTVPRLNTWSSTGLLLAEHSVAGALTVSAFDVSGRLVNSAPMPGVATTGTWAPDGTVALLQEMESPTFWLWNVASGSKPAGFRLKRGLGVLWSV